MGINTNTHTHDNTDTNYIANVDITNLEILNSITLRNIHLVSSGTEPLYILGVGSSPNPQTNSYPIIQSYRISDLGISGGHTHTSSDDLDAGAISAVSLSVSNNVTTPSLVLSGLSQITAPGSAFRLLRCYYSYRRNRSGHTNK